MQQRIALLQFLKNFLGFLVFEKRIGAPDYPPIAGGEHALRLHFCGLTRVEVTLPHAHYVKGTLSYLSSPYSLLLSKNSLWYGVLPWMLQFLAHCSMSGTIEALLGQLRLADWINLQRSKHKNMIWNLKKIRFLQFARVYHIAEMGYVVYTNSA
jgi:hypothetical protein